MSFEKMKTHIDISYQPEDPGQHQASSKRGCGKQVGTIRGRGLDPREVRWDACALPAPCSVPGSVYVDSAIQVF